MRLNITKRSASGNRSSWLKVVTSVDMTKTNGYAFDGYFLDSEEKDLPEGTIIIEKAPMGSVKNSSNAAIVYRVSSDPEVTDTEILKFGDYNEPIASEIEGMQILRVYDWKKEFLSFRDYASELLCVEINPLEEFSDEDLIAEVKRRGLQTP